jgi:hypothetical protein
VTGDDYASRNGVALQKTGDSSHANRPRNTISPKSKDCISSVLLTWFGKRLQQPPLANTASRTFQAHSTTFTRLTVATRCSACGYMWKLCWLSVLSYWAFKGTLCSPMAARQVARARGVYCVVCQNKLCAHVGIFVRAYALNCAGHKKATQPKARIDQSHCVCALRKSRRTRLKKRPVIVEKDNCAEGRRSESTFRTRLPSSV